jgi:hypothetical protein
MALKRKNFTEQARELSESVRSALKAEVRRRDFRQLDLEKALGRSHGYFSHLFAGRLTLTVEGVLEVLLAIGADPAEFFATALGSEEKPKAPPSSEEIEATVLRALKRYGYAPGGEKAAGKKETGRP